MEYQLCSGVYSSADVFNIGIYFRNRTQALRLLDLTTTTFPTRFGQYTPPRRHIVAIYIQHALLDGAESWLVFVMGVIISQDTICLLTGSNLRTYSKSKSNFNKLLYTQRIIAIMRQPLAKNQ